MVGVPGLLSVRLLIRPWSKTSVSSFENRSFSLTVITPSFLPLFVQNLNSLPEGYMAQISRSKMPFKGLSKPVG